MRGGTVDTVVATSCQQRHVRCIRASPCTLNLAIDAVDGLKSNWPRYFWTRMINLIVTTDSTHSALAARRQHDVVPRTPRPSQRGREGTDAVHRHRGVERLRRRHARGGWRRVGSCARAPKGDDRCPVPVGLQRRDAWPEPGTLLSFLRMCLPSEHSTSRVQGAACTPASRSRMHACALPARPPRVPRVTARPPPLGRPVGA